MGDEASVRAGQADSTAGPVAEAPGPDLVRREILIPGGHGAAFAVRAGQLVEIIDLEGQQVADLVAFAERNRTEWLSTTHTRSALLRLTAVVGDRLDSNWRHPMFEIIRDDVGRNDIITSMCDDRRYRLDFAAAVWAPEGTVPMEGEVFHLEPAGAVAACDENTIGVVAILGPGDFFGEKCLVGEPLHVASASALARAERSSSVRVRSTTPDMSDPTT